MLTQTGCFRRSDRILRSREFSHVLGHGEKRQSRNFVVVGHKAEPVPQSDRRVTRRLGITVSRRVGNAVTRNRVKRGIREWFRQARQLLPEGFEIVVIARPPARGLTVKQAGEALNSVVDGWIDEEFRPQPVEPQ